MEEKNFECRTCGSSQGYEDKKQWNGILGPGGHSQIECYYCKNCSVMFMDPKLFSVSESEAKK